MVTFMKIMFITNASSMEGRANIDIFLPAKELMSKGYDVFLISRKDIEGYQTKCQGGSLSVYPLIPNLPFSYIYIPYLVISISRLIKELHPDLLVSDGDFGIPILTLFLEKLNRLPNIYLFREMTLENFYRYYKNPFIKLFGFVLSNVNHTIFRKSKYLLAIDRKIQSFYQFELKRDDVKMINLLCVDMSDFKIDESISKIYRNKFGIAPNEVVLLYNGAMEPYRRIDLLIDAFSKLKKEYPYLRLVLSGLGVRDDSRNDLIENCQNLRLSDSVIFLEWLPREEMPKIISMADICVDTYPKQAMTPSGKLIEWMASGKCIVSPSNPGDYLLKDGFNGILYSPGNGVELMQKLRPLIINKELRDLLGTNARSTVETEFEVKNTVLLFEKFLQGILSKPGVNNPDVEKDN